MNISIAIADSNKNYLERLVEGLQEYEELSVSVFTNARLLEQAMENKRFDVVLFDPDIDDNKLYLGNTKLAICLYSDEARNTALYADNCKIIKYQRISKLYKEIVKEYADKAGYSLEKDNSQNARIIAMYSPIGGSGKTTLALALGTKFALTGKNVLIISLEQMESAIAYGVSSEDGEGVTMLLEALGESTNFELKLKSLVKTMANNVSYLEGFDRVVDYNTVTKEEMEGVITKIKKVGNYDAVVIDMGCTIDAIGQVVFSVADTIVVVEKSGELAARKLDLFANQAITCEYAEKMVKLVNFAEGNASGKLNMPGIGMVRNYGNQPLKDVVYAIATKEAVNADMLLK